MIVEGPRLDETIRRAERDIGLRELVQHYPSIVIHWEVPTISNAPILLPNISCISGRSEVPVRTTATPPITAIRTETVMTNPSVTGSPPRSGGSSWARTSDGVVIINIDPRSTSSTRRGSRIELIVIATGRYSAKFVASWVVLDAQTDSMRSARSSNTLGGILGHPLGIGQTYVFSPRTQQRAQPELVKSSRCVG